MGFGAQPRLKRSLPATMGAMPTAQTAGRALTLLLRVMGCSSLLALIFVVAPESWMSAIHAELDMGSLPTAPVVGYLARSTSAFYAVTGGLFLVVSNDLVRHRAVLLYLGRVMGLFGIVLLAAAAVGLYQLGIGQENDEPQGGPIAMPSTQGDFSLTQLGDNEIAIISFGYTYCPDVCPMNQAVKRQALAQLSDAQRERVVPVMITVDPERDTLDRMSEYMQFFGSEFIGLAGSQEQLTDVAERYGVIWRRVEAPESAMAYTIDHSASLFLVNREGEILQRVLYSPTPHGLVSALESELGS